MSLNEMSGHPSPSAGANLTSTLAQAMPTSMIGNQPLPFGNNPNAAGGKKAVHVKWAGKTIALGTFPQAEADEKCARAKALTRAWRSTMRPKPNREWVMLELERLQVRVVSGRLGRRGSGDDPDEGGDEGEAHEEVAKKKDVEKKKKKKEGAKKPKTESSPQSGTIRQEPTDEIGGGEPIKEEPKPDGVNRSIQRRNSFVSREGLPGIPLPGTDATRSNSLEWAASDPDFKQGTLPRRSSSPGFLMHSDDKDSDRDHSGSDTDEGKIHDSSAVLAEADSAKAQQSSEAHDASSSPEPGIPPHRPLVGGGSAAAYEAARADHYRNVAAQQRAKAAKDKSKDKTGAFTSGLGSAHAGTGAGGASSSNEKDQQLGTGSNLNTSIGIKPLSSGLAAMAASSLGGANSLSSTGATSGLLGTGGATSGLLGTGGATSGLLGTGGATSGLLGTGGATSGLLGTGGATSGLLGTGGATGSGIPQLGLSVNPNQHYEMLKLHHMNLLNEIQETTLMMNLYQQQQLQQQQQQQQLQQQQKLDQQGLSEQQIALQLAQQQQSSSTPFLDSLYGTSQQYPSLHPQAGLQQAHQQRGLGLGSSTGTRSANQMQALLQQQNLLSGGMLSDTGSIQRRLSLSQQLGQKDQGLTLEEQEELCQARLQRLKQDIADRQRVADALEGNGGSSLGTKRNLSQDGVSYKRQRNAGDGGGSNTEN